MLGTSVDMMTRILIGAVVACIDIKAVSIGIIRHGMSVIGRIEVPEVPGEDLSIGAPKTFIRAHSGWCEFKPGNYPTDYRGFYFYKKPPMGGRN